MAKRINSFRELEVYQECCALDYDVFVESKAFPREEMYSLTDQIRRSSRAIGANISEAWAKRRYPAHFVSKLTDADGELQETRHWLGRSAAYQYVSQEARARLDARCDVIGGKLGWMIQHPEDFT